MLFVRFSLFKSFKRNNHSVAGIQGNNLGNFVVSATLGKKQQSSCKQMPREAANVQLYHTNP